MKSDNEYYNDLQELFKKFGNKTGTVISRWPKYLDIKAWIIRKTPKLDCINVTLSTRIYWILNGIIDFPVCRTCGKQLLLNASIIKGYTVYHCSNKCAQLDINIQNHKKQTCMDKYGVEFAWQAESVKQHIEDSLMKNYGVKHPLASKEI